MNGERGQSELTGVALLLGLTILGTTAVVALGGTALTNTQDQSELARAEQSMTLFDSQAAQVALGDSSVQTVDFGRGEGTYSVDPNAGSISIVQLDCDDNGPNGGSNYDNITDTLGDDDAYVMKPTQLGAVTYETIDGKTIAYQGGGVWRGDGDGGAVMVSPPEFHYREATLTLPVVLTRGSGGASGAARATVTASKEPVQVFANVSNSFPTPCTGGSFLNPITKGSAMVRVESQYARAWGSYFETRTAGEVTYFDSDGDGAKDDVVTVQLISPGQVGDFEMPGEGGSITVSGASGDHATENFSFTLRPDNADSADFSNLQWSMYAEEGQRQIEINLKKSGTGDSCSDGSTNTAFDASIYYSDDGGTTYQGWHGADAFAAKCTDFDGDGDDEIYVKIGVVDDGDGDNNVSEVDTGTDPMLEYQSLSSSDLTYFNPGGAAPTNPAEFNQHSDEVYWESKSYVPNNGETESIDRLVRHYFALMPEEFDLTVDDKNSDTVSEDSSSGRLITGGSDRYVTYLHVTKNEIKVEVE